jgi:4'-phosphopantetheinyl transferase EntD
MKEAVYKAWYPLAARWLGFEDASISIDIRGQTFDAELLVEGPIVAGRELRSLSGRWRVSDGFLLSAVVLAPT